MRLTLRGDAVPRRCTVCVHPERRAIDASLVAGEPYRVIAKRHGVSHDAVNRHRLRHLPAAMVQANAAAEAADANDLLTKCAVLEADARRIGGAAESAGDLRTALAAVRELVRMVELLARLRGEMDDRPQVSLTLSPQFVAAQQAVLVALEPYPEARIAVAERLAGLEP